jgi:hypothetical protein
LSEHIGRKKDAENAARKGPDDVSTDDPAVFSLLHFSDTHNNSRATDALVEVANRYPTACVAITGDVCTYSNKNASTEFDNLPHRRVWLVPGDHDGPVEQCLGNLNRVRWQTPFADSESGALVVGLDTRDRDIRIFDQIALVRDSSPGPASTAAVVLAHHPLSPTVRSKLIAWMVPPPHKIPFLVCHGHVHADYSFYAEHCDEEVDGVRVCTSHVYSANVNHRRRNIGAANLIEVTASLKVRITAVYL